MIEFAIKNYGDEVEESEAENRTSELLEEELEVTEENKTADEEKILSSEDIEELILETTENEEAIANEVLEEEAISEAEFEITLQEEELSSKVEEKSSTQEDSKKEVSEEADEFEITLEEEDIISDPIEKDISTEEDSQKEILEEEAQFEVKIEEPKESSPKVEKQISSKKRQLITMKLWEIASPMMIIPAETGVVYENQTHGTTTLQDSLEGILIPVNSEYNPKEYKKSISYQIESLFSEGSAGTISKEIAQKLETIFQNYPETKGISVDWEKLLESHEAWLHVIVSDTKYSDYSGLKNMKAILTWNNSD